MMNTDKLETGHGIIHQVWGRELEKPIEYSYVWEHSDDEKENKKRARKTRIEAIQSIIAHLGMEK